MTQLLEFHVHNRAELVAKALAGGQIPQPPEDEDDDPDDLVGALLFFVGSPEAPGAETITATGHVERLDPDSGDELHQWSTTHMVTDFGPGHRTRTTGPTRLRRQRGRTDFAALFPAPNCACGDVEECETCGSWHLTPRTAHVLTTTLSVLADEAYGDCEEHGDAPVAEDESWMFFDRLPHLTRTQGLPWRRRIARACDDLAGDLKHGHWPEPRCLAEEVVLDIALDDAPAYAEMERETGEHRRLPKFPDDYDWGECQSILYQDWDFQMLYEDDRNGVAIPDNDLSQAAGTLDTHADAWFEPFGPLPGRAADRGFRR
ncbi:hypothetical protein LO772_30415 [Yinghuangia sp. ASG 101]|uniref:hypothetical protein n=1 Tax=Yinghuangia sp. ASG 101 TaxID=2896848 RepID=UPI001E53327E|nr:hypothetical protein [Yinghuangia sp. ASG 101]UGQ11076.1 hypothetical protein LO772_30415 [Yinghuangia sp. ASG 101]